jgi:hypothetical protein
MKKITTLLLLIIGTIFFGLLNVIYHWLTDWFLGIYIGRLFNVDLLNDIYKHFDFIIFNSLYSGPRLGNITLIQILLVMIVSGFFATKTVIGIFTRQKLSRLTIIMTLIFWVVKIPVTIEYSNFYGLYLGLLAW